MKLESKIKISKDTIMEIDNENLSWILSLLSEEGELPEYALKYVTVIAAE